MDGGQGYGVERVEGRPAQHRRDPPAALLVCLWIPSLQAEEEEPSGGRGPSLPRKRYLQRVWVGGLFALWFGGDSGGWFPWGLEEEGPTEGFWMFRQGVTL